MDIISLFKILVSNFYTNSTAEKAENVDLKLDEKIQNRAQNALKTQQDTEQTAKNKFLTAIRSLATEVDKETIQNTVDVLQNYKGSFQYLRENFLKNNGAFGVPIESINSRANLIVPILSEIRPLESDVKQK